MMKINLQGYQKWIRITAIVVIALSLAVAMIVQFQKNKSDTTLKDESSTDAYINRNGIVLNYCTWDDERFYMEPMVEAFNATYPNIQIVDTYLDSDYYDDIISGMIEEESYDIIGIRGFTKMVEYQQENVLIDMSQLIQNSDIDVTDYGNMYNNISFEGKYYGMPTRSTCWVLVYNKDIFDRYNEPYPLNLTWDEYRQVSLRITEKAKEDGVWGGYFAPWIYNFSAVSRSSYLYDDDLSYSRESLELLNALMNIDKSHMTVTEMEESEYTWLEMFEQGKVAMMPEGEWFVGMVLDDIDEGRTSVNWDLARMPIFEGQKEGTTWGQYQMTGITTNCDHVEAAFNFIKYISGSPGATILAQHGMLGAYNDENIKAIYQATVGDKNTDVFFDALRVQEFPVYEQYEELYVLFKEASEKYLYGEISIEEAMKEFIEKREALK